ncbi:MAG: hypothetical protein ACKVRP_01195 [Bacteroidota bacterium]
MHTAITQEELGTLTGVVKEYLTDLRSEILDTDDQLYKQELKYKEEILCILLGKFEHERRMISQVQKTL